MPGRLARIVAAVVPDGTSALQVGLVAPGGHGSSEVLAAIADRLSADGGPPLSMVGRRLEGAHPFGALAECIDLSPAGARVDGGSAGRPRADDPAAERRCRDLLLDRLDRERAPLLVDDGQWLDHATLRVVVGLVERAEDRGVTVIAAHRPAPRLPVLAALDAALSRRRPLVRLEPLGREDVAERAAHVLGRTVDPAFVETLHAQTAGVPALVDGLALAWGSAEPPVTRPARRAVPPEVIEAVRIEVDQLPPIARSVLTALTAGAELDDQLMGQVTGLAAPELGEASAMLESGGLLERGGHGLVPVVATVVSELTPTAERRRLHASLADALAERGAPPTDVAEHLAAAGAQGRDAVETYIAAGEMSLADAPELARAWFDRAASAGAARETAAARAEAAALAGDSDLALRMADSATRDRSTPQRERALAVMAALLPGRGFWRRSADIYRELDVGPAGDDEDRGPDPSLPPDSAAPTLLALAGSVVAGAVPQGPSDEPLATRFRSMLRPAPRITSLAQEALTLTARGLVTSLDADPGGVESPFLEAAELLESAHSRLLLPDTPHAIGATVALALCEPGTAQHLLTRAVERDVGGRTLRLRHRLLLGWVAVRSGRWSAAQAALADAAGHELAPRERLFADAIDAGLARRAGDLPRLAEAWGRAEGVLLRHSPDLLSLDAVGELTITASRLGHWDRVSAKARDLGDVLRALGEPPLWLLPLRWAGLQAALASDDHEAVSRRTAEIEAITPAHRRLEALAEAARTWVAILNGRVEPNDVAAASRGLQALGLTWEASRLTGQAAIRSSNPSVTRALLEQARDLRSALPTAEADQDASAASVLSERELVVAQYVVDGLTYKEIGAQLYISPKTVEHHVAKIRQKLGSTTRAEMLAALRTL
ncbi:MAG: LuxR C-terminal-related transcriptional regulator [Acidimicrobiales bacterium]